MQHEPELIHSLEAGQLTAARSPLPRRRLGRGTLVLLFLLRIYVFVAVLIVCYAFVHALQKPAGTEGSSRLVEQQDTAGVSHPQERR